MDVTKFNKMYVFLLGLLSPMLLLNFGKFSTFQVLELVFVLYAVFFLQKMYLTREKSVRLMFLLMTLTFVIAMVCRFSGGWFKTAMLAYFFFVPIFFMYGHFEHYFDEFTMENYIRGLKVGIIIQLLWCILQILFFYLFRIDVNAYIFTDILGVIENASKYGNGVMCVSGLCWHPANLAPLLVIAICLMNNFYIKILSVVIAAFSGNSTVVIGVLISIILLCLIQIFTEKNVEMLHSNVMFVVTGIFLAIFVVIFKPEILSKVIESIGYVFKRVFSEDKVSSTIAHMRYYTSLGEVMKRSSLLNIVFGYGEGCSGYPFTAYFGQYTGLIWTVESDIVDTLLSRGILGFLVYYYWLIKIVIKSWKYDKKIFVCLFSLLLEGITYNIQFSWVILFEIIIYICINKGIQIEK